MRLALFIPFTIPVIHQQLYPNSARVWHVGWLRGDEGGEGVEEYGKNAVESLDVRLVGVGWKVRGTRVGRGWELCDRCVRGGWAGVATARQRMVQEREVE